MPAADRPSPLSVQRAFVVQFRLETDLAQGQCAGRVEHVASGQATLFDTLEELMAFMTCILAQVPRQPTE